MPPLLDVLLSSQGTTGTGHRTQCACTPGCREHDLWEGIPVTLCTAFPLFGPFCASAPTCPTEPPLLAHSSHTGLLPAWMSMFSSASHFSQN